MTGRRLPKYVSEFTDVRGKQRTRFRRKGQADHYFKAVPWSVEFMIEYQACLDGKAAPKIDVGAKRTKAGTILALIALYYTTPEFTGTKATTQATYRGILERFRAKHGEKSVATIERKHIKAIIGAMSKTPAAANNLLDRLKTLMALAIDEGMRSDDPTLRVKGFKLDGQGFHTWTENEIEAFEARHPLGSKARLALCLMLYLGQRRSDIVRMGWQHVDGARLNLRQQKTGAVLELPILPPLQAAMEATPKANMTFLVTEHGKPFTPAGFGNWFRDRCNEAGLQKCSAHGLRKAAARRLAEGGKSNQQIKAVTGHKTDKEVSRYTAAADQARLAKQAMDGGFGAKEEQKLSNASEMLDKTSSKALNKGDKK